MKKRIWIFIALFAVIVITVLFSLQKTVYVPVRTEIYFSSTEREEYLRNKVTYRYDRQGHPEGFEYYNHWDNELFDVATDFFGNVTSYHGMLQVSDDALQNISKTYTYRRDGKLLKSASREESKEWTYDSAGRVVCVKRIRGSYTVMMRYDYDENGNLLSGHYYRVNGDTENLYASSRFTYSQDGKRLSETHYDSNGTVLRDIDYRYEGENTIVRVSRGNSIDTMIFDSRGNLIEDSHSSDTYFSTTTYVHTYKAIYVSIWCPRQVFLYTDALPSLGFFNWFDLSNVDP